MSGQYLLLGVDGGGSKTEALLVDQAGQVIGFGQSGGSNHQTIGLDTAIRHIREAAQQALAGRRAQYAAHCLAGADLPPDFALLKPALTGLGLSEAFVLYNDVIAVFRAGSSQPFGMAVVCGMGFNAGGISRDGCEERFPALGAVTGDRAGGGYIGEAALGAAFRAWDGRGPVTCLQQDVMQALGADTMLALAERLVQNQITHWQIAALTPLVFAAAARGDAVARGLIREQGREIGTAILAILRRLDLLDVSCQAVLGGSVFYGEGTLLMRTVRRAVRPFAPLVEIKRLDMRPVVGAALLAADRAGIVTDQAFAHALQASLPDELRLPGTI
ncbi:MAG: ATPase [Anaerolineae bacterium]|nr:ATPase [Anaerolineae bacterium]